MVPLILASASPRRSDLLRMLGFSFRVMPSGISETTQEKLSPPDHVLAISKRKGRAVAKMVGSGIVIAADTIVDLEGEILEKPVDLNDAVRMLERLSGNTHQVRTGVTLVDAARGREISELAATAVTFRSLSPDEIQRYVAVGESMDKAGAYAAQGRAAVFIESVSGCFYNVIGLPLSLLWEMMEEILGGSPHALLTEHLDTQP